MVESVTYWTPHVTVNLHVMDVSSLLEKDSVKFHLIRIKKERCKSYQCSRYLKMEETIRSQDKEFLLKVGDFSKIRTMGVHR